MATENSSALAGVPRAPQTNVHVIERLEGWNAVDWGEIWRYRELLYFLTWRDVQVRYKQTVLGALWALLQPLVTMAVFALFFGRLAGLGTQTGGVPYPLFVYVGLLPWTFFSSSIAASGVSLIGSAQLITKVYLPRLIVPLSTIGSARSISWCRCCFWQA
jgi:lipopolysaccharide transport system permease protein